MEKCVNLYVLGKQGHEKSALIKLLMGHGTEAASPDKDSCLESSTDPKIMIHHWTLATSVIIKVWDIPDGKIVQEVLLSSLTSPGMFLVVFQTHNDEWQEVTQILSQIGSTFPGSFVIISFILTNLLENKEISKVIEDMNASIYDWILQRKTDIKKEISELKFLIKEAKIKSKNKSVKGRSFLKKTLSVMRFKKKSPLIMNKQIVVVNPSNGFGISELKQIMERKTANIQIFPHLKNETVCVDKASKYITELQEQGNIFVPWKSLCEMLEKRFSLKGSEEKDKPMEVVIRQLQANGQVIDFNLSSIEVQLFFPENERSHCSYCGRCGETDDYYIRETPEVYFHHYICTSPQVFAKMLCDCFITKERRTFSIEASKFWPSHSGYKAPDPQSLAKILNLIPTNGIVIEALFPIIWQEYDLCQKQIQYALDVLEGLGVITRMRCFKMDLDCAGLAMPDYPSLSPVSCYSLLYLHLLQDNKPQLNWSLKPFPGDLQVTWQVRSLVELTTLPSKQILGIIRRAFKNYCDFSNLWNEGLLLKFKNNAAMICVETVSKGWDVSCRVSGDDPGEETAMVIILWFHLIPVIRVIEHSINFIWPGLPFKNSLVLYGELFYNNKLHTREPDITLLKLLMVKNYSNIYIDEECSLNNEINLELLFPFKADENTQIWTCEQWCFYVMDNYKDIFQGQISNTYLTERNQRPVSSSVHRRYKQRRKLFEVKWRQNLSEEIKFHSNTDVEMDENDCITIPYTENYSADAEANDLNLNVEKCDISCDINTRNMEMKSECVQTEEIIESSLIVQSSSEDWLKEATIVASKFVAVVIATGVAKYISLLGELGQENLYPISAAEVALAEVTADAALAVYSNDLTGAAKAVLKTVQLNKTLQNLESTKDRTPKSRLCSIL